MGDYKRQHSVTKAYLRNFTDSATPTNLVQMTKSDGSERIRNIDKCSVRTYYYSVKHGDGSWDHTAEKLFGVIEDESIPVLNDLLAAGNLESLTDDARWTLSRFIAATYRRSPLLIDHFHNSGMSYTTDRVFMGNAFDKWLGEMDRTFAEADIQSAKAEFLDKLGQNDVELKALQLEKLFEKLDKGATIFFGMKWRLVKVKPPNCFVTSDVPAYTVSTRWGNKNQYVRVGDSDCEFRFPLSREYFLLARHRQWPEPKKASTARTRELNAATIRAANRYVFATKSDAGISQLFELNRHAIPALPKVHAPRP